MHETGLKLERLAAKLDAGAPLKIMIIGLGSVGNYLLDYLLSWPETNVELHLCGRSPEKMEPGINIARVANLIRHNRTKKIQIHRLDLEKAEEVAAVLGAVEPDFIVNSSRVYSGLKYGSISWKNVRAYGLWSPLSVMFIRNIMRACQRIECPGLVINTSYSDVVNPWLKSAGLPCPDFGSGNLNHLVPRIQLAVAAQAGIADPGAVEVVLATGHFHDVVISKEGHTEGVDPLIHLACGGQELKPDLAAIYRQCAIPMPVDARRNMMNASSNFEIIAKTVAAIRTGGVRALHVPGVAGHLGGYPVRVDFRPGTPAARHFSFIEDYFPLAEMERHNRASMQLDGIEGVADGVLTYTDALREKARRSFGVTIPKQVPFDAIEDVEQFIIHKIILPALGAGA